MQQDVMVYLWMRYFGVAIIGEIESRFYQVRVPEKDRDLQRFLWFENGDPKLNQ